MKTITYLSIEFDQDLQSNEIRYFRSAVIESTRRRSNLFHNHDGTGNKVIYRYPLIQYKLLGGSKAGIVCLNAATEDIHQLIQLKSMDFRIGRQQKTFKIRDMQMRDVDVQLTKTLQQYQIRSYLPFNKERYRRWRELRNKTDERRALLAATIRGNILAFAKGVDWWIDGRVEVKLGEVLDTFAVDYKSQKLLGFNLNFSANIVLPNLIGLGKAVSTGHGTLYTNEQLN